VVARTPNGTYGVAVAASDGRLYTWDVTGRFAAPLFELGVDEPLSPTLIDLDQDGDLELVVVGRAALGTTKVRPTRSRISVLDLDGIRGTPVWGTFKRDAQRTGWYR